MRRLHRTRCPWERKLAASRNLRRLSPRHLLILSEAPPSTVEQSVKVRDWPPTGKEDKFRDQPQNDWAQGIVNASGPLLAMINGRQANGYQTGPRAFLHELNPFNY